MNYRGYVIYHDGTEFVAEPREAVSPICEIGGQSLDLIVAMIDELWRAMSGKTALPSWFQKWLDADDHGRVRAIRDRTPPRTLIRTQEIIVTSVTIDNSQSIDADGAGCFINFSSDLDHFRVPMPAVSTAAEVVFFMTALSKMHCDFKVSNIHYG